ncbi:MAG TPA: MFS transporter [Wenzhouxiangella sp.]|nr:MFS transporter [Wenzhouxiangella sp.]
MLEHMSQTKSVQRSRFVERSPIFYGWIIWAVATLGVSATSPGQSFSVSLFIDHYIADFGLSRTTVSGLYGVGTFVAALSLTWVGRQIDRHGNRWAGTIIATLFALALLACSLITGPLPILISFIAIRGLGQGSLGLNSTTAIAQWFQARRGLVMGISLVCFALFQRLYLPWRRIQFRLDIVGALRSRRWHLFISRGDRA